MSYLLLDDGFAENKKVSSVSPAALKVHITGLCYCARHLTDGHLDPKAIKVVHAVADVPSFQKRVDELVAAVLWKNDAKTGGYVIHDYLEHNLSARQVKAKKDAARKAARARWDDAESNADSNAAGTAPGNAERIAEGTAEGNAKCNALPSHALDLGSSTSSALLTTPPKNGHGTEGEEPYFARLHTRCGGTDAALAKLRRAARGKPEAAIVHAYEACTGPGVRDPLAVALAELGKAGKR